MSDINVPTPEGRLLLFPGWFAHGVPSNRSNRERVSVSFNLMPEHWTAAT
jgi:ectoine hydroxylase-related dioxygenase (phytanoyl-CoA dioxygenase family)